MNLIWADSNLYLVSRVIHQVDLLYFSHLAISSSRARVDIQRYVKSGQFNTTHQLCNVMQKCRCLVERVTRISPYLIWGWIETWSFPQSLLKLWADLSFLQYQQLIWSRFNHQAHQLHVDLDAVISKSSWMLQFSHQLINCNLQPWSYYTYQTWIHGIGWQRYFLYIVRQFGEQFG